MLSNLIPDSLWAVALYFRVFTTRVYSNGIEDVEAFNKEQWLASQLLNAIPTTVIGIRNKSRADGLNLRTLLDTVTITDFNDEPIDSTDPRDRVYGLLGIANDEAARDIIPDYTLSCEQAYIMTARALLRHG